MAGAGTFNALPIPGLTATSTKNPGTEHMGHVTYLFSPTMLMNAGYAYSSNAISPPLTPPMSIPCCHTKTCSA
jgi:hypothetical protein